MYVLDAGVLSRLAHAARAQYQPVGEWVDRNLARRAEGVRVVVPEIADYEVRRKLIHLIRGQRASSRSLRRLDELTQTLDDLPLRTPVMRRAAQLWADARAAGVPAAPEAGLDADVILAAQTEEVGGTVVTTNPRHLRRFVPVLAWADVEAGREGT